ncbi:MAG: hypothetical protein LBG52_05660 [Candidatus Peribacteria bacterium]|jgi:site-specific DNA-cytosine methylase|nr:hypothetical protein [Candidatus Peribacteria bacterium]
MLVIQYLVNNEIKSRIFHYLANRDTIKTNVAGVSKTQRIKQIGNAISPVMVQTFLAFMF